jgi:DNA polymerase III subunit delta
MSRHSIDDLLRAPTRDTLAPAYYFYGTETVLRDEAAQTLLDRALPPEERAFNFEQRAAAGLEPDELHSVLNALPMLGARRVVFIRDIEAWRRKPAPRAVLLKYLANPSPDTMLLLIESPPGEEKRDWEPDAGIVAQTFAVDFEPMEPARVTRWLAHHAKQLKVAFAEGAAEHLAEAAGYNLAMLRSELDKLSALPEGSAITREQIGALVGVRHGETAFDWRNAVLDGDAPRALKLLGPVLGQSGQTGVKLVSLLGTALLGAALARGYYDRKQRGPALERVVFGAIKNLRLFGLPNWKQEASLWSRWAERWPPDRVRAAIRAAVAADRALKDTRVSDENGVMTGLVLELASLTGGPAGNPGKFARTETAGV